ncbi:MAG TPA: chemotaxis protein CheV [Lachnospiraceae bacterium]|jgi:two-component system chemotaxis response regulator CheV|nr:chemotaxis protein [Lachnospiraceae bacterium]MDY5704988.1 chemotaxis protein [Lachnospiraceae bacterium]HAN51165.1 chemotaxis protein CheV [Lachnospiraceae bacterium]HBE08221.1 chemotaxis protein CheV [Lachnospiraceae bacterium]
MDTNILLESGTNELEILEFTVGGNHYGINVAKVLEIMPYQQVTPVPNTHPNVEGLFMPRDKIISVISLRKCLGYPTDDSQSGLLFITNFNNLDTAFHVDEVLGIHRVSWEQIHTPDSTISSGTGEAGIATGVLKMDDRLIVLLDFEKIISWINPETSLRVSDMDNYVTKDRSASPILLAEDSKLLMKLIQECLTKAGYTNLILCENGQEAWNKLRELKEQGDVLESVHCIITDIEMPQMDGHRLTKLVKSDDIMKNIPVIIFSSLINDEIRRKGEALGADAQLTKPEVGKLVDNVDRLVDQYESARNENKR